MKINTKNIILILTIIFSLVFPANVYAATVTVTNNNDSGAGSLRQAISDAISGDTIVFDGDYTITLLSALTISKDLTIDGIGYVVNISGNDTVQIFDIGSFNVTLNNLTLRNGFANGTFGGAIENIGNLTISNMNFLENKADAEGGAIYTEGSLSISNSDFDQNNASDGGAIYLNGGTISIISESTFDNNSSTVDGGAIDSYQGEITTISNTTFSGNAAGYDGGAIALNEASISLIFECTFTENTATNDGGAIESYYSSIETISYSTFTGNNAEHHGGAIDNYQSTIESIANSTFSKNMALDDGGGIYNYLSSISSITDSTFSGNASGYDGGAIYNEDGEIDLISNNIFANNFAENDGGAINNWGYDAVITTIIDSTFSENTAVDDGGAIENESGFINLIANTTFSNNKTTGDGENAENNPDGGAIENWAGIINIISNSTFFGNSTQNNADDAEEYPGRGGAIWNASWYGEDGVINSIINSSFIGNSANGIGGEGGGIYNSFGYSDLGAGIINNISNTIIAGNSTGGNCFEVPNGTNNITDFAGCDSWANTGFVLSTLGPLADNGGPTKTQALLVGSLAIDGGDPIICAASPVDSLDQRGFARLYQSLCDIGAFEYQEIIEPAELPDTGFPRGVITQLSVQPDELKYENVSVVLKIPNLDIEIDIVGVPLVGGEWDTSWLGNSAGWLNGTAFPTWKGNTVLTGHVWDSWNQPGLFRDLDQLQAGDQFSIIAYGLVYTYQVQDSFLVRPGDLSVVGHSDYDMVTLLTCEGYNLWSGEYRYRRAVQAVLISIVNN